MQTANTSQSVLGLRASYVTYIKEKLSNVYNNYFPYEEVTHLENYFDGNGVIAEKDQEGNPRVMIRIRTNPLRIEINELATNSKRVAWQLNGQL